MAWVCMSCGFWYKSYNNRKHDSKCTKCGLFAVELLPNIPEGWTAQKEREFKRLMRH